jgi:MoaA/NifB/PqqE/SkfB family radical SAM enzyme
MEKQNSTILVGFQRKLAFAKIWSNVVYQLAKKYPNPVTLAKIVSRIREMLGKSGVSKIAQIGEKYFLSPNFQAIPSDQFYSYIFQQANKALGEDIPDSEQLNLGIIAITKKCPLNCEHCCESAILNQREVLTDQNLQTIVSKLQDAGVSNFIFGGGEPMVRIKALIEVLNNAKKTSDFWIITSGFNVTPENTVKLKKAGLTGITVSLDHFDKDMHNKFRRDENAFDWALNAVKNAQDAGLATALTACVTREFCTRENLKEYMQLAIKNNVPFVQFLEPSAVGNYEGKDVVLLPEHIEIMDQFYLDMKNDAQYAGYPILLYHGYENRRVGCIGSGVRHIYVDTDGMTHNCPMCRKRSGNILTEDLNDILGNTRKIGCSKFSEFAY